MLGALRIFLGISAARTGSLVRSAEFSSVPCDVPVTDEMQQQVALAEPSAIGDRQILVQQPLRRTLTSPQVLEKGLG